MDISRAEHLQWCKDRVLQYVDNDDPAQALTSMLSDLRKHRELANHAAIELTGMLMIGGHLNDVDKVRRHIEGFN